MSPSKQSSNAPLHDPALREQIVSYLEGWLAEEREHKKWRKFVKGLSAEDMAKIARALGKKQSSPDLTSLPQYLKWYRTEKKERLALVDGIGKAMAAKDREEMKQAIFTEGKRLNAKEADAICKSEESMARYFSTLSVTQLESYKQSLETGTVKMSPEAKKVLLKLFEAVQKERFVYEQEWVKNVAPAATEVAVTLKVMNQLDELEALQKSLGLS